MYIRVMNHENRRIPAVFALAVILSAEAGAQTSATGAIVGAVTDASNAAVEGATLTLVETGSNASRTTNSGEEGLFTFASVQPGEYRLTVSMTGFRQAVIQEFSVEVAKSYALDVKLEIGIVTETITVTPGSSAELQTLDATVGAVIKGEPLLRLPTINRSAGALMALQPLVTPSRGAGPGITGQVAGTRSDQNTFSLDGSDATDLSSGAGSFIIPAVDWSGPVPMIPVPLESVEEFRVSTTNPNATFGRSSGGQVSMVTKRGANTPHGSAYWYHQNDNLNANTWTFNRLGIKRQELKDNRFGVSLGGPAIKDKTFLYGHYEGRRFPKTAAVSRLVPSEELRQGILRFRDAGGTVVPYDVRAFDPRSRGLSPVISSLWNKLPSGNDPSGGDGLNTLNFTGPGDNTARMDFGVTRLDHHITSNWRLAATYRYAKQFVNETAQVDIAGLTGGVSGQIIPGGQIPVEPRYFSAQISGTVSATVTNELNLGYARHFWVVRRINPFPQVPGTAAALMVGQGTLDSGIDVDTGRARSRTRNDRSYQIGDNLTWIKGKHAFQFGGIFRSMYGFIERDDRTGGSMTTPVYEATAGNSASIGAAHRPPTCGAAVSSRCLQAADVARWNTLFAAGLGMIDKAGVLVSRDGDLNSQPLGTPLRNFPSFKSYDMYVNDIWRVAAGLTITAGLTYSLQTPPTEKNGQQTIMLDNANNEPITVVSFYQRRAAAAQAGQIYNPTFGFQPIRSASQKYIYDTDWNNVGPRIAAAWNPSGAGMLGRIFGAKRSVIRAGYGVTFDRINGGSMTSPLLGVGFSQTATCNGPRIDGSCANFSDATNAFRIGVDGASVNIPSLPKPSTPITPGISGETLSNGEDPKQVVGRSQSIDFTVQRELPGNFIVETGFVTRISTSLKQTYELNAVPYMMVDTASGQTMGQAMNLVADQVRSGVGGANVRPQPFFENQLRGASVCNPSCTAGLASARNADFNQGRWNTLTNFINNSLRPNSPYYNRQVENLAVRGSEGESFYSAGFVSLVRRFSSGLQFSLNYTLSRTLDQYGQNQEATGVLSNPYDLATDWGPAIFDRTHVVNAN
ncbi:MAG: carboxypeptidase regulatory-like domain-containing protein [Bryobacteraceae bacterium]